MANKNDYISDNLITIRDRLRESAATIRENTPADSPSSSAVPAAVPGNGSIRRQEEGMRAKQDLAGRLAQDLARITALLEEAEQRTAQMRERKNELEVLARQTEELTPLAAQEHFAAEADRLRLEYFRLKGRQEALTPAVAPAPGSAAGGKPETIKAAWIIAGAVFAGAALIAGAAAVIFM